jgi:hypothetical protein
MQFNLEPVEFAEPSVQGWDWPLLWDVEYDPGIGYADLRKALSGEDWKPLTLGYGLQNTPLRQIIQGPFKSKELDLLDRSFKHPGFKHMLIETLNAIPFFRTLWPSDRLMEISEIGTQWSKDLPGYTSTPHLDNRLLLTTGMIFFNEKPDPLISTHFTKTFGGPIFKTSNSGFGQGWLLVHDHHGWHHGGNRSNTDRYHLTFHLRIRT